MIIYIYLLSTALLSEFFDNKVIYFLVEFHHMVSLVLIVDMAEADLGVLVTDFDFDSIFVCQKYEFFESTLKMLNFSENESRYIS